MSATNHVIRVTDRKISVDGSHVVANGIGSDTITLELDSQWDDLTAVVYVGDPCSALRVQWEGEPIAIPAQKMDHPGWLPVSVVGYDSTGAVRVTTEAEPKALLVRPSGVYDGRDPYPDQPDLLGQLVAAGNAANDAAKSANEAASRTEQAVSDASAAAESANSAATSAKDAEEELRKAAEDGEFDGEKGDPGFSPKASVTQEPDGATISITDESGTTTAKVSNGADGSPGRDGESAEISGMTATVDGGSGTPSVDVEVGGTPTDRTFSLSFHNLKGDPGERGETPTVGIGTVDTLDPGSNATASVTETETGVNVNFGIPRGDKGNPGDKGDDGAAATISVGTVTTGDPGTEASVTNSGTTSAAVLDFVIPQGPKGDKGDPGDPGTVNNVPVFDDDSGRYTNDSIAGWLSMMRDGRPYGVSVPKGLTIACTKTRSNVGIANPVPGTAAAPGTDPYATIGPFFHTLVNGGVDADGTPYVTAIEGDGRFSLKPDTGDVFVLAPTLYWLFEDGDSACELVVSDAPLAGLSPQPKAELPDGSLRPYMLYARYGLSFDADGNARSVSGGKIANRTVSHDSMITSCKNATTGYSGKSYADDWYAKAMFLLKYATKDSQSVFKGCSQFSYQYHPAVAETGVKRVILTASQASNVPVGSSWMLGTSATGQTDRNNSECYDVFDGCLVTGKEEVDGGNVAVTFDVDATFDTATTYLLSSSPWRTGVCDEVEGDGSPTSNTGGLEPFVLQGIEMSYGLYECLADVILHSDGSTGWQCYLNPDSRNETTSTTDGHISTGVSIPASPDTGSSLYSTDVSNADGLLVGTGSDGSSTTGLCDATYSNKTSTSGDREFLTLGYLGSGGGAGLWFLNGGYGLGAVGWYFGSRLSVNGRSRG